MTTLTASTIPDEHFRRLIAELVQQWREEKAESRRQAAA